MREGQKKSLILDIEYILLIKRKGKKKYFEICDSCNFMLIVACP